MIAYQIAKASLIYDVSEIIVLKELPIKHEKEEEKEKHGNGGGKKEAMSAVGKKVVFNEDNENGASSSLQPVPLTDTKPKEETPVKQLTMMPTKMMMHYYWLVYYNFSSRLPT